MLAVLAAVLAPAPAPVLVTVQAGQTASITVTYPRSAVLLNRDAPNTLRLKTPWAAADARPTGAPNPDAKLSAYFGRINATELRVRVPKSALPGSYAANINAELFVCDQVKRVCSRQQMNIPIKLQVVKGDQRTGRASLELRLDELKP